MFKFGPLHDKRHDIIKELNKLPLKSGDIFYRASNAKGPLGLPFSRMVSWITNSPYSHAAIALIDNNEPYVMEVNDEGTLKLRIIDWLDTCYTAQFSVYRYKYYNDLFKEYAESEINKILEEDPDYDFTFAAEDKYYCTESVAKIYARCGIELTDPYYIKDCLQPWGYPIFEAGNFIFGKMFGTSLPLDKQVYFVGNEQKGMMSSDKTNLLLHYTEQGITKESLPVSRVGIIRR